MSTVPFEVISEDWGEYPQRAMRIAFRSGFDGTTDWALHVPGDANRSMVVYLHGSFSNADQILTRPDVRDHWLPRIVGAGHPLLSINMRNTSYMNPAATRDLHDLIAHCRAKGYARKVVLLGGSGGASSAMAYACVHPATIDGVVAMGMCDIFARLDFAEKSPMPLLQELARVTYQGYGGSPADNPAPYRERSVLLNAAKLMSLPIILAMGEEDMLIPVAETRRIAEALKGNPRFRYVEIPGGGHDAPLWLNVDFETLEPGSPAWITPRA